MDPASAERRNHVGSGSGPAEVIAILVTHNSALHLPRCLSSLETQRDVHCTIYVVDNASSDGTPDLVRREFPRVRLQENSRNLGFARANNQVLDRERAEFYALVNPDTAPAPDALAACVEHLRRDAVAGVAAARLVSPNGNLQPSCHAFLDLRNLFGETLGLHRILPGVRAFSSLYMPWFGHDRVAEVDWIQGAFLVVRDGVVRTVGGFDPEFFMYGEEMDWCRRIRGAGWKVVFLPEPDVIHVGGASSRPAAGPLFVENLKGRVRFLRKHRGALVATVARGLIALSVLLRFAWREAQALGARRRGRTPGEALRMNQARFRWALRWVLRGLPLSPPDLGPAPPHPE